jgi:hypothetical protein
MSGDAPICIIGDESWRLRRQGFAYRSKRLLPGVFEAEEAAGIGKGDATASSTPRPPLPLLSQCEKSEISVRRNVADQSNATCSTSVAFENLGFLTFIDNVAV